MLTESERQEQVDLMWIITDLFGIRACISLLLNYDPPTNFNNPGDKNETWVINRYLYLKYKDRISDPFNPS